MSMPQANITIVGLGPDVEGFRTLAVDRALAQASRIFVRLHPDLRYDDLLARDNVTDIATLRVPDATPGGRWRAAVEAVCDAAVTESVVLAIPGHPRFGEGLVAAVTSEANRRGQTVRTMDGISVVDLVATALGIDPILAGAQLLQARNALGLAAQEPFAGGLLGISPRSPVLLTHVYDTAICTALGTVLGRIYPAAHPVIVVNAAGLPSQTVTEATIGDLSTMPGGPLVALWIPAMADLEAGSDSRTMQHIVARLRQPDGCPWDRKQTNQTLRKAIIDEAYELVDAIDSGDMAHLAEELGDMYLLLLMHAQIAHEAGAFAIEDVYQGIATKIVGRHPHVFGEMSATDADDVVGIWQEVKAKEKAETGRDSHKDIDGEPFSMPALTRAPKVLRDYPLVADDNTPDLLRLVAEIVARGDDPDTVLREQLREHIRQHS
jgi:tetrapyrrole methylase family protein/MazG family protein